MKHKIERGHAEITGTPDGAGLCQDSGRLGEAYLGQYRDRYHMVGLFSPHWVCCRYPG